MCNGRPEQVALGCTDIVVTARNKEPQRVGYVLEAWYRAESRRVFAEQRSACWPRVAHLNVLFLTLGIRRMKRRWGSCGRNGHILLNLHLLHMPIDLIDYVMVHEFCHLKEHNHSTRCYALLATAMPDWQKRRARLSTCEFS